MCLSVCVCVCVSVCARALQKLGELGLKDAESVVLTGETHGGTAAALIADSVGELLRTVAPKLKRYPLWAIVV